MEWICDLDYVSNLDCNICFNKFSQDDFECVRLKKCFHYYHYSCIISWFNQKQTCPICNEVYGKVIGNQPPGTMNISYSNNKLPNYDCNTIVINYNIPSGIQSNNHPNPGSQYKGASRTAYLPNNNEGIEILELLKKAFDQKLIFTVGTSLTTGEDNVVRWNGIHHKTSFSGSYGYPDPTYFSRVKDELKNKGLK